MHGLVGRETPLRVVHQQVLQQLHALAANVAKVRLEVVEDGQAVRVDWWGRGVENGGADGGVEP